MNKRLPLVVLVIIAAVICVGVLLSIRTPELSNTEVQVASSTVAVPPQDNAVSGNNAPTVKWKVGEKVGNLEVVSIAPHSDSFPFDAFNVDVIFVGEEPVEGRVEESEMLGPVLRITKGSLPCDNNSGSGNSRCDTVIIDNARELGFDNLSPTDSVEVKAVVTKYVYTYYPAGGAPVVTLTKVVRK